MSSAASIDVRSAAGDHPRSVTMQRWGALIGGGALAVYGVTRRSKSGIALAAAGGVLAYAGVKAGTERQERVTRTSVLVNCSPEEAYRFWRNFENLPQFMHHLDTVTVLDARRSKWIALGPLGTRIQWTAEIVAESEPESITWHTLPGSDLDVNGSVRFHPAPANRGTLLDVSITYRPIGGRAGHLVAKLLGKHPHFLIRQDLRRFKALIEAGEIPTIEGQPHGPRDVITAAARLADPDRPVRRESNVREVLGAKRRVS